MIGAILGISPTTFTFLNTYILKSFYRSEYCLQINPLEIQDRINLIIVIKYLLNINLFSPQWHYGVGLFWKKSTCTVMIRIIITFGNQIFL